MKRIALLFLTALACSCGNGAKSSDDSTKTSAPATSMKDALSDALADLPPETDLKQFKWAYSLFVQACTTKDSLALLDKFISPADGIYVIESNGAMPQVKHVTTLKDYKTLQGKDLLPINRDDMICDPKDEELPKVNCDSKDFYSKSGCFTQENNTFKDEKIWQYSHLSPEDEKKIEQLAATITRTVVNTKNYRYYFSLINGSWRLTFIDLRKPCNA